VSDRQRIDALKQSFDVLKQHIVQLRQGLAEGSRDAAKQALYAEAVDWIEAQHRRVTDALATDPEFQRLETWDFLQDALRDTRDRLEQLKVIAFSGGLGRSSEA
jgi:hypothetical protein